MMRTVSHATRSASRSPLLTLGILVVGSFLVVVAVPDIAGACAADVQPTPSPSALATLRHGALARRHRDAGGRRLRGLPLTTDRARSAPEPIPVMAHPLLGWRDCTACHTHGQPRQDGARPLEPAQGRLPDLPPDAGPSAGDDEPAARSGPEHMGGGQGRARRATASTSTHRSPRR